LGVRRQQPWDFSPNGDFSPVLATHSVLGREIPSWINSFGRHRGKNPHQPIKTPKNQNKLKKFKYAIGIYHTLIYKSELV
jgi:hypothetical protein